MTFTIEIIGYFTLLLLLFISLVGRYVLVQLHSLAVTRHTI